ncbi:hypothetical protein [Parerythrobacter aestuarii]|uniref:hypothetical protein n=1 Tax=Parerythrobacter aestuarii TaxID=3020909 RepID=UPI0024DE21AD|nr:hypothetical protein [Parerythrobacter aestuarii]
MPTALPIRILAAAGTTAAAMIAATPALAQQMGYEQRVYEYAQPAPEGEPQTVFVRQPVVQPIPEQPAYQPQYTAYETYSGDGDEEYAADYEVEYEHRGPMMHHPMPHPAPHPMPAHHPQPAYQPQQGYPPMPPVVDRKAWIGDCQAYLRDRRKRADRGAVAGGLLGAAAGAAIGNRVAGAGERLGGSLIGGGVGGLVGLFIGQAIALAGGDGTKKDCKNWLKTYEESYATGGGRWPYPMQPGYGWNGGWHQSWSGGWSGGYVVVPMATMTVYQVPMVPVVREVVREEWVEETVMVEKTIVTTQPKPVKKVRYIKSKPTKPVKYIKGK